MRQDGDLELGPQGPAAGPPVWVAIRWFQVVTTLCMSDTRNGSDLFPDLSGGTFREQTASFQVSGAAEPMTHSEFSEVVTLTMRTTLTLLGSGGSSTVVPRRAQ